METLNIPTENDIKKWVKQGLVEYFENHPIPSASGQPPIADPFLNRKQVAGMFKISLVTLHDWMNKGLPFHKRGGRVFFMQSEVVDYVKAGKRKPTSFGAGPRKMRSEMFK